MLHESEFDSVQEKVVRMLWAIAEDEESQPSVKVKALSELDRIYNRDKLRALSELDRLYNKEGELRDENYFIIKPVSKF